jgi:Tfp pilus assembly protein PilX
MAKRTTRLGRGPDETGASLILALIFLVVVSLIVLSMATWTSSDLTNSIRFTAAQSTVATANSATEVAVQDARYYFDASTLNASPPVSCLAPATGTINGLSVSVWCSTQWNSQSSSTRVVTFSTCPSSQSAAYCAANPLLQAVVTYDDYPTTNNYSSCPPVSTTTTTTTTVAGATSCGTGMTIDTWVFGAIPPTVTSVTANAAPPTCSTTPITILGTGFTSPATVTFVVNGSNNTVYAATNVTVVNTTTITACEPSSGSGTADVIVTTPTGTSPLNPPKDQITY